MVTNDQAGGADSIPMDRYGDAARKYMRARTAAVCAAFFLPHLKPGMKLLDCGCGEGTITVGLAPAVAPGEVVGIDISSDVLDIARRSAQEQGLRNIRFRVANIYELPFPDASFDAVFSHALFEHLTDKPKALSEIHRVLKPGGIVGLRSPDYGMKITEPADDAIGQYWTLFTRLQDELGGDSQVGRKLCALLSQAGFVRVEGSASLETYGSPEETRWYASVRSGFAQESIALCRRMAQAWLGRP